MSGFFSSSLLIKKAPGVPTIPRCGACQAYKTCKSPKLPHRGKGKKRIMLIGEFPSEGDDESGKCFSGDMGRYLRDVSYSLGINILEDCWLVNAAICKPKENKEKTLTNMVDCCSPNVFNLIKNLDPIIVVPMGRYAVRSILSVLWKEDPGPIKSWLGWTIPSQQFNVWVCPTDSVKLLLGMRDGVAKRQFAAHLEAAFDKTERPWKTVPDWKSEVEVIMDPDKAASVIQKETVDGGLTAVDVEANALKPEYPGVKIYCISFSFNSGRAISTPFLGPVKQATRNVLRDKKNQMIAANMKYEDRMFRHFLDTEVANWFLDTMIAAHVLDSRGGTKSLKFQAFVHFGVPRYNYHIEPLFEENPETKLNRIDEVDPRDLNTYCALDSHIEKKLAIKQIKLLNEQHESLSH